MRLKINKKITITRNIDHILIGKFLFKSMNQSLILDLLYVCIHKITLIYIFEQEHLQATPLLPEAMPFFDYALHTSHDFLPTKHYHE